MAVREALWDCQYCDKTAIPGRYKRCPNCSRSRPEGTKFYLPENAAEVTDAALLEQAEKGPDWICAFCDSSNAADADTCSNCLASKADSEAKQKVKEYGLGEAPTSGDLAAARAPAPARPQPSPSTRRARPAAAPRSRRGLVMPALIGGGVLLALLCLCSVLFFFFRTSTVDATVAAVSWERNITVEAYQTVTEEGWSLPSGGRILSQSEEIREYEQVLDHYETRERQVSEQVQVGERTYVCGQRDLGNGFFEDIECTEPVYETQYRTETYEEPVYREEPVYDTYFVYEIDKWIIVRTERSSGSDHEPYWPEVNLGDDERQGVQTGRYVVVFTTSEGERHEMEMDESEWRRYEVGDPVELTVNGLGNVTEVQPGSG